MSTVDADTVFGDWTQDDDGVWERRAARVIVVDPALQVLMLRGVDVDEPARSWWFTPGGGIEAGEDDRAAAVRELFEETGIAVTPDQLIGPVAERIPEFTYFGRRCRQYEVLYFAEVPDVAVHGDGWTEVERASVTEVAWRDLREMVEGDEPFYPAALPAIIHSVVSYGWDGRLRAID